MIFWKNHALLPKAYKRPTAAATTVGFSMFGLTGRQRNWRAWR
jgi:hypothetical protein